MFHHVNGMQTNIDMYTYIHICIYKYIHVNGMHTIIDMNTHINIDIYTYKCNAHNRNWAKIVNIYTCVCVHNKMIDA